MTIRLYDLVGTDDRRFSPPCWRVKLALRHKGLPFVTVPTRFTEIAGIAGGETKTVPAIVDGGELISDSWAIVRHLEKAYPDHPTVIGGPAAEALTEFVDAWTRSVLHVGIAALIIKDIHDACTDEDRSYFRSSREGRFGCTLEEMQEGRAERLSAFRESLLPLRVMLKRQPFLGGDAPLYADYVVAGALLWARCSSPFALLETDDPVAEHLERVLDHSGGFAAIVRGDADAA